MKNEKTSIETKIERSISEAILYEKAGFDPSQSRDRSGRWTSTGALPADVRYKPKEAVASTEEFEGSTFDLWTGKNYAFTPFYSVSIDPDKELILDKLTEQDITDYINKYYDYLKANPNKTVGTWLNKENDKYYLDITTLLSDRKKAEDMADEAFQIAYFDLGQMEEYRRGEDGIYRIYKGE
jgi:hypothetical protein